MDGPEADALWQQQEEMTEVLGSMDVHELPYEWARPTRCDGWDIADVVLHVAQTNEMAIGSLTGRFAEVTAELTRGLPPARDVDDGAALMVARDRSQGWPLERWLRSVDALRAAVELADPDQKVQWVAGQLRARTLATTRLAETWIHTGDVAEALDVRLEPHPRLRHVARLAWRTIPYAFQRADRPAPGPTAFHLIGPDGAPWDLEPDGEAVNVVSGSGVELCNLAAQRCRPGDTSLVADGPDAAAVLDLVRTYA